MTLGIRQECPFPANLFLFVVVATKLETNENIIWIKINDYEIRKINHADDLTITVQNEYFWTESWILQTGRFKNKY